MYGCVLEGGEVYVCAYTRDSISGRPRLLLRVLLLSIAL